MSLKRLNELRQKRGELVTQARQLTDLADTDKRSMTAEERAKFDDLISKSEQIKGDIEREERLIEEERAAAAAAAQNNPNPDDKPKTEAELRTLAFRNALLHGLNQMDQTERRALQMDSSVQGGFIVAPEQFVAQLLKDLDNATFIRPLATVMQINGSHSIGVPTLENDVDDADWTTELATGSEDGSMSFGKRSMEPHPLGKRIKVSNNLIMNASMGVETIVRQRLAYKFGVTQEKAYLLGTGNKQPLGLFTASNDGIPTSRDVSTGNTTTSITGDGLIEAKYTLKQAYHSLARWLFHRDAVKQLAKLKDGEGQYLWQPGLQAGQPDRLLNMPLMMSEYVPNTFTTGQYVGMLGDYSHYWILDNMMLSIQRLAELYAETNQTGFIGRYQGDGAPTRGEAFVRVKLG